MSKVKKVSVWLSAAALVLIIIVTAAFFIASNLIQKDSVKDKIHGLIADKVGGDIDYETMTLHFFHRPHVLIKNTELSIPDKFEGTFDTVIVYPKILPLLYGNVEVSELKFLRPKMTLMIPEKSKEEEQIDGHEPFSYEEQREQLVKILDYLNSKWKGFNARIDYANLTIKKSDENFLEFNNLNAVIAYPNNSLNYRIRANSNISQTIALKGVINTKSYDADGNITLTRFKPHILLNYLSSDNKLVTKSNIDIDVSYKTKSLEDLSGNVVVSNSELTLSKGDQEFEIKGNKIDTDVVLDEDKTLITLNSVDMEYPDIKASGQHRIDKKENKVNLNLNGNNIDVESSRNAVLFMAGGDRIVDLIFNIVRGGTIPNISLTASGEDFRDLWRKGNFVLKANLIDGNIFIPYGDFDLTDVSGDALIADGKLTGTDLKAKSGTAVGHDGTFIIGIEGPIGPLHLDIMIDSDASEIPPIIKKFVDDEGFLHELSMIKNLQGTAQGKLKIGDQKKSPKTNVYVSELDITADYERVPLPVNVKGSNFNYNHKSIDFEGLKVKIGEFSSPETTGSYHWESDKILALSSKNTKVDLAIIFPWLTSFNTLKDDLRHIESIKGSAFFSFLNFKGPVNDSEKWEIGAEGNINTVELGLQGLDTDMTISEAQIKTTTQELAITETTVDIKDSKMTVGAVLTNYLTDWLKLQMDFYGNMLAEEAKVFSDYFNVPTQLNFNSPVEIAESNIVLKKKPAFNSQVVGTQLTTNGTPVTKELDLNINIVAGSMNWADSEPKAPTQQPANELPPAAPGVSEEKKSKTALNGKVNIKSDHFEFKGYNWDTVKAEVAFLENQIDVNVNQANLCGISTPGVLEVASPTLKLQFEPFSEEANLAEAIKCLFDKAGIITGDFDFGGTLNSNSDIEDVLMAIEGELEMTSSEGRVSKYGGLARFLSALNFGEMFRGNNIDYEDGGFPYEFIKASANIEEGKLIIREAAMDGPSLKVVCDGSVDLINNQVDLKVIVIPVLAVDSVIEKIPIISMLLGKDVVSIPIRVTGDISDPTIEELSPHTIGAGLLGIIKQTLNIPVTLVKPLNSGKKKETTETDPAEVAGESTDE